MLCLDVSMEVLYLTLTLMQENSITIRIKLVFGLPTTLCEQSLSN